MKNIFCIILTIVILCSSLVACSGSDGKSNFNSAKNKILDVSDFGAIGDGKTDDYKAISDAINEAHKYDDGVTINFKSNTVYRISNTSFSKTAMDLSGMKNAVLQGDNTTIMVDGYQQYISTIGSENLKISGLNFKYEKNIYTLSDVIDISLQDMTMTIKSEDSLGIDSTWISPLFQSDDNFGIINDEKERQHLFFSEIEVVDASQNLYKLKMSNRDGATTIERLANIKNNGYKFVVPMPDVGQVESSAFEIYNSKNVTFENCNVWSAAYFVFSIRYCTDTINFVNTNLVPEPGSAGVMMSWRDQFHCKDNRAKISWKGCTITSAYDDVFNLACTTCKITDIISPKEIVINCPALGGTYPAEIIEGDTVTIYNADNGFFCGTTQIEKVIEPNRFLLKDELPNLTEGVTFAVDSLAAPDSVVEDCNIDGTIRIQTKMSALNTKFNLYNCWIGNAGWTDAEGTIPNDVIFKNCEFSGHQNNKFVKVSSETASYVQPKYFCKNIVFEDCNLNPENLEVLEGNDVKIIKNGSVVFSSLN